MPILFLILLLCFLLMRRKSRTDFIDKYHIEHKRTRLQKAAVVIFTIVVLLLCIYYGISFWENQKTGNFICLTGMVLLILMEPVCSGLQNRWSEPKIGENQEKGDDMNSKKGKFVTIICILMIPFIGLTSFAVYKVNQKINSVYTITQEIKDELQKSREEAVTVSGAESIFSEKMEKEKEDLPKKFVISRFTEADGMSFITCDTGSEETYRLYQLDMNEDAGGLGYVLELPDGGLVVVDGGYYGDGVHLRDFLKKHGGVVNAWILTHPHYDHIGAFLYCMKEASNEIKVQNVYYSPFTEAYVSGNETLKNDLEYEALRFEDFETLRKNPGSTSYVPLNQEDELELSGLKVTCLWSFSEDIPDVNDNSLVLRLDMNQVSMLVTGDVTETAITRMIKQLGDKTDLLNTDFVQIPHHGYEGTGTELYKYCQPRFAMLDCSTSEYKNNVLNIQSQTVDSLHESGIGIVKRFEGTNVIIIK